MLPLDRQPRESLGDLQVHDDHPDGSTRRCVLGLRRSRTPRESPRRNRTPLCSIVRGQFDETVRSLHRVTRVRDRFSDGADDLEPCITPCVLTGRTNQRQVVVVEPMGNENIVHLQFGARIRRCNRRRSERRYRRSGRRRIPRTVIHLFDADSSTANTNREVSFSGPPDEVLP